MGLRFFMAAKAFYVGLRLFMEAKAFVDKSTKFYLFC